MQVRPFSAKGVQEGFQTPLAGAQAASVVVVVFVCVSVVDFDSVRVWNLVRVRYRSTVLKRFTVL